MRMKVMKCQTNGNDFIIMPNVQLSTKQIIQMCDRHYGIGCDQLIMFKQVNKNTFELLFYNNDGLIANMCGNGSCAFTLFANKYISKNINEFYIHVCNNQYKTTILNNKVNITFPMPYYIRSNIICTGNYHKIYDIKNINNLKKIHNKYPTCNIHFIKDNIKDNSVKVITYERGAGRTLACGSGAIAIAFFLNKSTKIIHEGGISEVLLSKNSMQLITEPRIVCECVIL